MRRFCKRACCGHAGSKPKRNEIMQAGFWKGSLVMQSKSFLPSKNMIGLYIQYNILSLSIFSDVPGYSSYITLTGVCNAICTKVYNASCMILDPWTGIPQGFPISDLNSWGCIYIYIYTSIYHKEYWGLSFQLSVAFPHFKGNGWCFGESILLFVVLPRASTKHGLWILVPRLQW